MKLIIVATCTNVVKMVRLLVRSHFVVSDLLVVINSFTTKVLAPPVYDRSAVLYRCETIIFFLGIYNSGLYIYTCTQQTTSRAAKRMSIPGDKLAILAQVEWHCIYPRIFLHD